MTKRGDFNADEWASVTGAPALAALQVMAADRGGTLREAASLARVYNDARKRHSGELVDEIVARPPQIDPGDIGPKGTSGPEDSRLADAVAIVEQHADADELEAYRQFIVSTARAVATAHKEGGFLGVGGKEISDDEQAALDRIETAVGADTR